MTPAQAEHRGLAWVLGAFVICPCHLPLTLWAIAAVLSGTAAGALLHAHIYVAGAVISGAWLAATWRGVRYFRAASRVCDPPALHES
jgi:cytochrome c biogenesis protein CcdA